MRPIIIAALLLALALGVVEGVAYWWMHPKPAGLGEPVLVYRPGFSGQGTEDRGTEIRDRGSKIEFQETATAQDSPTNQKSAINNLSRRSLAETDHQSSISSSSPISASTLTPLPDIVAKALPSLRCSTGTAARIDRDDDVTLHVAFFEWDLTSSTSVLEAFKHLPEECMGSIGMTLVEKAPVRTYVVRGQGTGNSGQEENQKSAINNLSRHSAAATDPQSSISPSSPNPQSPIPNHSLFFDHTIFRDQTGVIIHAFKGTWVSGATDLLGEGVRGGVELWNQIRRNAAFKRFRPAHARVVQGAVRGIPNPDLAWEAFEEAMLRDLSFQ